MTQPLFGSDRAVTASAEFYRVSAIPRRVWTIAEGEALSEQLSPIFRRPGRMCKAPVCSGRPPHAVHLLPQQAIAVREVLQNRGGFLPMGVGSGKTLTFLVLGAALEMRFPGIRSRTYHLVKAGLDNAGRKSEIAAYLEDWSVPAPQVLHFDAISPVSGKNLLEQLDPLALLIDEIHHFKNPHASRTARFRRWRKANPDRIVVGATGSITKRSIKDFAHIVPWCLPTHPPVPTRLETIEEWADALDERLDMGARAQPGALLDWCTESELIEYEPLRAVRRAFRRRLVETPGVVVYSVPASTIGAELHIEEHVQEAAPAVVSAFGCLRNWELPDGTEIIEALDMARHVRTMPLGYWLRWRYPAPVEWLEKRKAYMGFIRAQLGGRFDSPDEVARAFPTAPEVSQWRAIKKSYEPETIPEWIDGAAIAYAHAWMQKPGVVFCDNTVFGQALAHIAGCQFYGPGGLSASGQPIERCAAPVCVASVKANGEGRNLQRWSRGLLMQPPPNNLQMQQNLGRWFRIGQKSARVDVTVFIGCLEHAGNLRQCVSDAQYATDGAMGDDSQLLSTAHIKWGALPDSYPVWRKRP